MTIKTNKITQHKSDKEELERLLAGFNDFLDLFSEVKEIFVFEVDSKGRLQPNLLKGTDLFGYSEIDFEKDLNALELFIPKERGRVQQYLG